METFRLSCYILGFLLSIVLVGRLSQLTHPLARVLVVLVAIWAGNCAVLAVNLLRIVTGEARPGWSMWAFSANAVFLVLGPLMLLLWFVAHDRRKDHE